MLYFPLGIVAYLFSFTYLHFTFKKYKTIFLVDVQLYQHEWKLEKREIVWKHKKIKLL